MNRCYQINNSYLVPYTQLPNVNRQGLYVEGDSVIKPDDVKLSLQAMMSPRVS